MESENILFKNNNNQNISNIPDDIQWMPAGIHKLDASSEGKPISLEVNVTEATFNTVKSSFDELIKQNVKPYIDFNHQSAESAGRVLDIFWGGLDSKTGGIRAKIKWSKKGYEALEGGLYCTFSPSFKFNKEQGVVGISQNMGGLVNEPAFRKITPIAAKNKETNTMEKILALLVQKQLISDSSLDEDKLLDELQTSLNGIFEKLNSSDEQIKMLQTELERYQESEAQTQVQLACKDGKILDEQSKIFWKNAILKDGQLAINALKQMPKSSALERTFLANAKKNSNEASAIKARAQEIFANEKISFTQAWKRAESEFSKQ